MKKVKKIATICLLTFCVVLFSACGSSNSTLEGATASENTVVAEADDLINFGDGIRVETEDGDFTITLINVHQVDWSSDRDDVKIVTVQAEVYNESYDCLNWGGLYSVFLAEYVSLVDDEGFDLEFYPISGGDDGVYEVGATTSISSQKRVSLPYYVSEECESVKVRIQDAYTDAIYLNEDSIPEDTPTDNASEDVSSKSVDIESVVSKIENCTYESVGTVKELIDEYFSQMNDTQKESCLLALAKCEAPSDLEEEIKETLKSPRSFYLYECTVYSHVTYDEDEDRYCVMVEMKYGATNSFNAEVTNTVSAFCYYKIDLTHGDIDYVDISVFDY